MSTRPKQKPKINKQTVNKREQILKKVHDLEGKIINKSNVVQSKPNKTRPPQQKQQPREVKRSTRPKLSKKPAISYSVDPAKSIGGVLHGNKGSGIYAQYDRFAASINGYLQTLLNPWSTGGSKIPKDDVPSCSYQLQQKFNLTTDANGNAFIALGVSRSLKDGSSPGPTAVYSVSNSSSLLANVLKETDSVAGTSTFSYNLGIKNFGALDTADLFKGTAIENIKMDTFNPDVSPAFLATINQFRVVSGGATLQPLGAVTESKGIMYATFIPYGTYPAKDTMSDISLDDVAALPYTISIPLNSVRGATVLYRPTDEANLDYTECHNNGSFTSLEDDESASPGGLWFAISGYTPDSALQLSVCLNLEVLPKDSTFTSGLARTVVDQMAIDHADNELQAIPACFEGSDLSQNTVQGQTNSGGMLARRRLVTSSTANVVLHSSVNSNQTKDHHFRVNGQSVSYPGPQAYQLGGLKETIGGIIRKVDGARPMITRIINEWGPIAAKLALAGVALL